MNRNQMYIFLEKTGLKKLARYMNDGSGSYHFEFVLNADRNDYEIDVLFDWGYVTRAKSIAIHRDEIIIYPKYTDMEVHIDYKHINDEEFEVRVYNSDGGSTYRND